MGFLKPFHPLVAAQPSTLLVDQESVEDCPGLIEVELAEKLSMGAWVTADTVTVAYL